METPLSQKLHQIIKASGPVSTYDFMKLCLYDENHGVYRRTNPIGQHAHFTTAPEISQIFGETLGVWAYLQIESMAAKGEAIHLIELGPGRGTLMSDLLRSFKQFGLKNSQLIISLVETSESLKKIQKEKLYGQGNYIINWYETIEEIPKSSIKSHFNLLIANEFFDCFPVRQFIYLNEHWYERLVGLTEHCSTAEQTSSLPFLYRIHETPAEDLPQTITNHFENKKIPQNALVEYMPDLAPFLQSLKSQFNGHKLSALVIDYGSPHFSFGDTIQALYKHEKTSPFAYMGMADLTAHVQFSLLSKELENAGFMINKQQSQQDFLISHGIKIRTGNLIKTATDKQAEQMKTALFRLIDTSEMGTLFNCISFSL